MYRSVRPLLDARRSEIIRYLHDHNLSWHEDPSNLTLDYARNRIRHNILPELLLLNPQAVEAMVRTIKILEDADERLARMDRALLDSLQIEPQPIDSQPMDSQRGGEENKGRLLLDLESYALSDSEQRAVLRLALQTLLHNQDEWHELSFEQIDTLRQQLQLQHTASQAHPIVEDVVWSVVAQTGEPRLLLSLHR